MEKEWYHQFFNEKVNMIAQTQKMSMTPNTLIETVNATTALDAKLVSKNTSIPEAPKKRFVPILLKSFLEMGVTTVSNWFDRTLHRRELMNLDDHLLKDIGLTRWDVLREYEKPFWKA